MIIRNINLSYPTILSIIGLTSHYYINSLLLQDINNKLKRRSYFLNLE